MKSLLSSFVFHPRGYASSHCPLSQPAQNGQARASASPAEASSAGTQGLSDTGIQCSPGGFIACRAWEVGEAQLRASVCLVSKTSFPPVEPAHIEQSTAPDMLPREWEKRESDIGL